MKAPLCIALICHSFMMMGISISPGFIKNVGQHGLADHPEILFISSGSGSTFYFTPTSIISVQEKLVGNEPTADLDEQSLQINGCRIDMTFQNAQTSSYLTASGPHHERLNYYLPGVKAEDRTITPMDTLTYKGIYQGVDLVVYWKHGGLKYDWHVTDHSSIDHIAVQYDGFEKLTLNNEGVDAKHGEFLFRDEPLFIYEKGSGREIKGHYVLNKDIVSLQVDLPQDIAGTVIIDPIKTWATYVGGSMNEFTRWSTPTYTAEGNIVMSGQTLSLDFPVTPGAFQTTYGGGTWGGDANIFLFDSLKVLQWSTYIGGSDNEQQSCLEINSGGEIVVVGSTGSTDFPFVSSTYSTLSDGTPCGYILWVDQMTGQVVRSTSLGYSMVTPEAGMTLDSLDNIYILGITQNPALPTTSTSHQPNYIGGGWSSCTGDLFVAKYDNQGYPLAFTYIGGTAGEKAGTLKIAPNGNVFAIGRTCDPGGPATTPNAYSPVQQYQYENFICELTPDLGTVTLTYLGCVHCQPIIDLTFDSQGALYVMALYYSGSPSSNEQTCDLMDGPVPMHPVYIMKIDIELGIQMSTFFGGPEDWETGDGIVLVNDRLIIINGTTCGGIPITPNALQPVALGGCQSYNGGEGFLMMMNTDCQLLYSSYISGSGLDAMYSRSDYSNGKLLLAGITQSEDIPLTPNAFQTTHGGLWDIYMEETLIDLFYVAPHTDQLCPGSDLGLLGFNYGYSSAGPYEVEISDDNGSFADPISLGVFNDVPNMDTTWITMPPDLPEGNGYVIRVTDIATGQHFLASAGLSIDVPVVPSISYTPNFLFLTFGIVDWYDPNGEFISTGQYIVPTVSGTYTAVYHAAACSIMISYYHDITTDVPSSGNTTTGIRLDQMAHTAILYGVKPRSEVVLINTLGMILHKTIAVSSDVKLDVNELSAGVYTAVISAGSGLEVHRFILY